MLSDFDPFCRLALSLIILESSTVISFAVEETKPLHQLDQRQ